MHISRRTRLFAALFLLAPASLRSQTAADPSGHWKGKIQAPGMELAIEIDLAQNSNGEFAGTISIPAQNIKGLPLAKVAVEGRSIEFHARADQTFRGDLLRDGKSISGELSVPAGAAPFSLTRTGDARIEAVPKSAPISKELEGTWNGALEVKGGKLRLVLTMSNRPDGTAAGSIVNLDEGGLAVPIAITQQGSSLTLDVRVLGGSYAGALNPEGTELVGTYSQGPLTVPLTFRRADATKDKK